ncbi:MAG: hypothetical protein AB1626_01805 [Candidatus Micrarchaeota archaeon]
MPKVPKAIAVFDIVRHSHNQGDTLTPRGVALAFKRGEQNAKFLIGSNPRDYVAFGGSTRGILYWGSHSPAQRAKQTEEELYRGLRSNLSLSVVDARARENPLLKMLLKNTPEAQAIVKEPAKAEAVLHAWFAGQPQELLAPRKEVEERMAPISEFVDLVKKFGETKTRLPLLYFTYVTHGGLGKAPGKIDALVERITGKPLEKLGGAMQHAEGVRLVVYENGAVRKMILRQKERRPTEI